MCIVIAVTAAALSACTPRPDGPTPAAEQFFARLAIGAPPGVPPDRPARRRPNGAQRVMGGHTGLTPGCAGARVGITRTPERSSYRYTWHMPKDRTWTYDGQLNMVRTPMDT